MILIKRQKKGRVNEVSKGENGGNGKIHAYWEKKYPNQDERIVMQVYHSVSKIKRTEDLLQDLWLALYDTKAKYPQHYTNGAYLFVAVRSTMFDFFNKEKLEQGVISIEQNLDLIDGVAQGRFWTPEQIFFGNELAEQVVKWADGEKFKRKEKKKIVKEFISFVDPTNTKPKLEKEWRKLQSKTNVYNKWSSPPLGTIPMLLGYNKQTADQWLGKLKATLHRVGYGWGNEGYYFKTLEKRSELRRARGLKKVGRHKKRGGTVNQFPPSPHP